MVKKAWEEKGVPGEFNDKLVAWYLERAIRKQKVFSGIILASAPISLKKGSQRLDFTAKQISGFDEVYWDFVKNLFSEVTESDLENPLPFQLVYVKKGDVIAKVSLLPDVHIGTAITGETIGASYAKSFIYTAGISVILDSKNHVFIADDTGFVMLSDDKISIVPPFIISEDKMTLTYLNLDRIPHKQLELSDIIAFFVKNKIDNKYLAGGINYETPVGVPFVVAKGFPPGESVDGTIEFVVPTDTKYSEIDESGRINYREVKKIPSVLKGDLLVRKKVPIKGENGSDLFGKVVPSRNTLDPLIKNGINTMKQETETEHRILANTDGLVDYKNGMISIHPEMTIPEDVDYTSGNINTKVNVHINGTVRTGFTVKSEKNILINGTIEDNCIIEAGGDLIINGGTAGANNKLSAGGNMSIKFIEGGEITVKGCLHVHRFIMGARVFCGDTITIMGAGLNMNERGAIIDSEIFVRNNIFCPSIGNDKGQKTCINFAYDKNRITAIINKTETLQKIRKTLAELNDKFTVDLNATNIFSKIKNMAQSLREEILAAIQEKNKLDKQYAMIQGMLNKDIQDKNENMASSTVNITNKVFAPLLLECDNIKKMIDKDMPASKFYFDMEERMIERVRSFGAKE
jgi:hypothetical protein